MTPASVGVTLNNLPLNLTLDVPAASAKLANYSYYAELTNITYSLILKSEIITLLIYGQPSGAAQPNATTTAATTTAPSTTIMPTTTVSAAPTSTAAMPQATYPASSYLAYCETAAVIIIIAVVAYELLKGVKRKKDSEFQGLDNT
jgi:hypothetical protein